MKLLRVTCCLVVLLLSFVVFAFLSVHPAVADGLNPPPPEGSTFTCHHTGNGSICQGTVTLSFSILIGVDCGSFQIVQSATGTQRFTLFYNQAGDQTRAIYHADETGTFSNSVTGASVPWIGHGTVTLTYATPGDVFSTSLTATGLLDKVTLPASGLILHDVGKIVFEVNGTVIDHGPHMLLEGKTKKLCAALK